MKIASPITEERLNSFIIELKAAAQDHPKFKGYIQGIQESHEKGRSDEGANQVHWFRHLHFRQGTPKETLAEFCSFANSVISRTFQPLGEAKYKDVLEHPQELKAKLKAHPTSPRAVSIVLTRTFKE